MPTIWYRLHSEGHVVVYSFLAVLVFVYVLHLAHLLGRARHSVNWEVLNFIVRLVGKIEVGPSVVFILHSFVHDIANRAA